MNGYCKSDKDPGVVKLACLRMGSLINAFSHQDTRHQGFVLFGVIVAKNTGQLKTPPLDMFLSSFFASA